MAGSQDVAEDPRNDTVLVWVNGALVPRAQAVVSVFDGGFIAGDGVWEGLRLIGGRWLFLDAHLDRLFAGAAAIDLEPGLSRTGLVAALEATRAANAMRDGVHARLMLTRGIKQTPSQDPRQAAGAATVVIIAEHKVPNPALATTGLALMTSTFRCTRPDQFDMRLNSHSRLPLILALVQAYKNGADEALMLDDRGFVASCNATNFFFVRGGEVCTSTGQWCFNGITRAAVIDLCRVHGVPLRLGDFTLLDVSGAAEAFVTGTFGGVTPVHALDGRAFPGGIPGPVTARLAALYREVVERPGGKGDSCQVRLPPVAS
jgi:branched-chain amino acid aminotransferase